MKKFWHYFIKKITFKAIKFNVRKLIFSLITNSVYFGIIVSFLVKGICAWLLGANYSLNFSPLSVQPFWSCMRYIEVGTEYYLLFPIPVLSISDSCVTEHPPPPLQAWRFFTKEIDGKTVKFTLWHALVVRLISWHT